MLNSIAAAAQSAPIPTDQLAKYDAALGFYETTRSAALPAAGSRPRSWPSASILPSSGSVVSPDAVSDTASVPG
jgi:hypothetical protein